MLAAFTPTPEQVDAVHEWRERRSSEQLHRAILPVLQARFGVSAVEAVKIIRAANKGGAHASQ
ncbi:MAG: hypothetical protein J0I86_07480 [Mesorhizobium sp.]|nr:hypothetical protein [Mesorhizobium sp.]